MGRAARQRAAAGPGEPDARRRRGQPRDRGRVPAHSPSPDRTAAGPKCRAATSGPLASADPGGRGPRGRSPVRLPSMQLDGPMRPRAGRQAVGPARDARRSSDARRDRRHESGRAQAGYLQPIRNPCVNIWKLWIARSTRGRRVSSGLSNNWRTIPSQGRRGWSSSLNRYAYRRSRDFH